MKKKMKICMHLFIQKDSNNKRFEKKTKKIKRTKRLIEPRSWIE